MDKHTATARDEHPVPDAWVHEATLELLDDTDPRAVGAAVTIALCGHWEHDGPCRWPHNNEIVDGLFRTLFVCQAHEEPEVRARIRRALDNASQWRVVSERARPVSDAERPLARTLAALPRRT